MDAFLSQLFGTAENMQKLAALQGGTGEEEAVLEELAKAAAVRVHEWNQKVAEETGKAVDLDSLTEEQQAELLDLAAQEILEELEESPELDEETVAEAFSKLAMAETFGRTWGEMMAKAAASEAKKKTYPISRALTSPITPAATLAGLGGAIGSLAGQGVKGRLLTALLGTGAGALAGLPLAANTALQRIISARATRGRAAVGREGLGGSERAILEALRGGK